MKMNPESLRQAKTAKRQGWGRVLIERVMRDLCRACLDEWERVA